MISVTFKLCFHEPRLSEDELRGPCRESVGGQGEGARLWPPTSSWISSLPASSQIRAAEGFPLDKASAAKIKDESSLD